MLIRYVVHDDFKNTRYFDDGKEVSLVPHRGSAEAAGYDLRAAEPATVYCNQKAVIRCGISIEIPTGYYGAIPSRSGLAKKHNVIVLNSPGTIDSDYRGEIVCMLYNLGSLPLDVKAGQRLAQILFIKHEVAEFEEQALSDTTRGAKGFGSTG